MKPLATYLNDHLAGSVAALELIDREPGIHFAGIAVRTGFSLPFPFLIPCLIII